VGPRRSIRKERLRQSFGAVAPENATVASNDAAQTERLPSPSRKRGPVCHAKTPRSTSQGLRLVKHLLLPEHVVHRPCQLRPQYCQRLRLAALLLLTLQ